MNLLEHGRSRARILVVEDEPDIRELIQHNLSQDGFDVSVAPSAEEGLRRIQARSPDLVILDLMLPGMPGLDLCRRLRQDPKTQHLPLLILTARSEESDVVLGLELGADDYVTKPFSVRELVSRVRAVLRRSNRDEPPVGDGIVRAGDIEIDSGRFEVRVDGRPLIFTPSEFRLLRALASRPGQVMTRDQLLDYITEGRSVIIDRNVDVHVRSLRKKLGPAGQHLVTVRGVGYKFDVRLRAE